MSKGEVFWMRVAVRNTVYDVAYTDGTVSDTLPLGLKAVAPPVVRLLQNPPTSSNQSYPAGCGNQSATAHATDGTVSVTNVSGHDVVTYSGWTLHSGAGANDATATNQGCFYAIQLVSDTDGYPGGGDFINTISANTVEAFNGERLVTNPAGVSARVVVASDLDTTKAFSPNTIGSAGGARTRLAITFTNKNGTTPITNLGVTDPLPSSAAFGTLTVASPANVSNTCGGTLTAAPGNTSVVLSGGTVPAGGSCSVEVDVLHSGGNGNTGSITNTIAAKGVTNDQNQSNNENVTATLTKGSMGVSVNKTFAVSQALGGRAVKLTLNFNATTASTVAQNLITVTDNLPAGMEVASNANIATTCLKQNGDPADVAVASARNAFTISGFRFAAYSNGAAPANSCTLTLDVILTTTGNKTNTIPAGAVGTDMGSSNASSTSATLSALANTSLQKQFNPKRVEVGSPSTMTLTVINVNSEARTDFALTDALPQGMIVAAGSPSHTCGNGVLTAVEGGASVAMTGGDVGANASCTITVPVTLLAAGAYENGPSNFSGTNYIDWSEARDELEAYASSLRGTVFVDPDLNGGTTGFVPAADTGLGGVTMELLRDGNVVATAVTAATDLAEGETFTNTVNGAPVSCTVPAGGLAAGQYLFCNLPSGTDYAVRETQPAGYTSTGNKAGTAGGAPGALGGVTELIETITVRPEENESGYDFGEYEQGITNVSGRVYAETGNNATDDGNAIDSGLVTTVAITCTGPGDAPAYSNSMTTNADGTYSFTGMLPGAQCQITETQPLDYSNAYTQTGMTGEPGALGPVDASEYGNPGDSVIASIVVPAAGSPYNNFAEIRLADMSSTTVCTPTKGMPGTVVSCTVTCTNAGPNSAANAFCSVPNAPSLPGSPAPVCENSPAALLGMGESLACTVSFKLPNTAGTITVQGGTGADNDTNGSSVPTEGNNPSGASVAPQILTPVPTLGEWTIMLMMAMLAGLGATRLRRR
ncbi:IPTL-CTERM sorting domain-containing protein [Ottowia sp. VDI28]|uniref:IPTL-CTERM sorting domain-containing protein n=1 Tax=Ottowia sp. VDI28 TaxID=3133968 RepID=UPI003C2E3B96